MRVVIDEFIVPLARASGLNLILGLWIPSLNF